MIGLVAFNAEQRRIANERNEELQRQALSEYESRKSKGTYRNPIGNPRRHLRLNAWTSGGSRLMARNSISRLVR